MTSLASERHWLLDPSLLKLFHQCRRLIQSEFGVKLHLTEEHLEQQLAKYASKSRSSHLTRAFETLQEKVPQLSLPEDEETSEQPPKRMYRGQVLGGEEPASSRSKQEVSESPPPQKSKRMYRGQVVG
ncbi:MULTISPECIES: hypothetical protein [Marinobacter]|uniref:Uncharacterized protein n=1 Tax=Marinobacter suaedae TaxID=3057675 RepID=A0ABT8W0H5_9GAMM|nr:MULTISPECIES: hypothetical protein [unclassified Marinobacter]MBZ2170360.1 hypothetical protein [Marinobacter sp. F4216]MDO3721758.1 hypothetical protein [Marinobacter sp. chi1]